MTTKEQAGNMRWRRGPAYLILLGAVVCARDVRGHEGPPFPLVMDAHVLQYGVSVWADPDIGEARFFVALESEDGGTLVGVPRVRLSVRPTSGRLAETSYEAEPQTLRNQTQFLAEPYLDKRDTWDVTVHVESMNGQRGAWHGQVESTPPGAGAWDLAIYLFPFLLLGGMWVAALARRRQVGQTESARHGALRRMEATGSNTTSSGR